MIRGLPSWRLLLATLCALVLPCPAHATMPPRSGVIPPELSRAFGAGLFAPPVRPALGLTSTTVQSTWVIPIIMVDFTDQPLSIASTVVGWEHTLFDTTSTTATGSVFDYYRWVSRQRIRVVGRVVAIVHLAHPKAYYANGASGLSYLSTPRNAYGAVDEALRLCDGAVDFSAFDQDRDGYVDMLWVLHSGFGGESTVARDNLWSLTSQMDQWANGAPYVTNDPMPGGGTLMMRLNRFSILPEMSAIHPGQLSEIGVFCHEFGHALGLPDLYETGGGKSVGPGNWSLMSTGGYGSDGASPEYPAHLGAWPMLFLGWAHADRPTEDTTVTIAPIENGGPVLELWFQGESDPEHFLIEERERLGFSRNLLAPGLIIYHVDDALIGQRLGGNRVNVGTPPGLLLVEADGGDQLITGSNRGDPNDVFPGPLGRTALDDFTSPSLSSNGNAITNLELSNMARVAGGARVTARVRAFGWQRAQLLPAVSFTPSSASGPATRGVSLGDGRLAFVASETRGGGRAQVWLRLRSDATRWVPPVPVSQSAGNALEPTLALLPRGGFAVAWSDTRDGTSELYYRSFIDGLWSAERRLTDLPGSSRSPALSTDPFGGVHLAWLYTDAGIPQVMFMNFGYQSPGATPIAVTGPLDRPDSPAVAAGPDGGSYLIWPERSVSPTKLWFSRFSPDSGLRPRQRLTAPDNTLQQAVSAVVGIDGSLHALWLVTNVGENELRYQKREPAYAPPSVRDTVLERRGEPMQNLMITTDPNGGVHTVFEASSAGLPQVRYKHSTRARGWDLISTEVTSAQAGIASTPLVVATRDSRADVLYLGYPGGVPSWMMRRRDASAVGPPTAVAPGLSHPPTGLLAWPNPLHAGESLRLRYAGSSPIGEARVALFDLGGRRVAETRLVRDGESWVAAWPAEASRGWAAGVYFARVEGCAGVSRLVVLR